MLSSLSSVVELMRASSSQNTQDLEAASRKENKGFFNNLKKRSTVTLRSITRTHSGPGGKRITQIFQDSSVTHQLPSITEDIKEKSTSVDLPPTAKENASVRHAVDTTSGRPGSAPVRNTLTDDDTESIDSASASDTSEEVTMTTNKLETAGELQEGDAHLEEAGCYVNTLSEEEITASERTPGEVPLDDAVRDHSNTLHNTTSLSL